MNNTTARVIAMTPTAVPARTLKVTLGHQYGQEIVQPACDDSRQFCEIAGTKTMTRRLIEQVKALGYRVEVIPTQPKEL